MRSRRFSSSPCPPWPPAAEAAKLQSRAAAHIAASPLRYPPAAVLLPALQAIQQQLGLASLAAAVEAVPALHLLASRTLDRESAKAPRQPPAQPGNWSRPDVAARVRCGAASCDCATLRAFLESGERREQRFALAKQRQKHLAR